MIEIGTRFLRSEVSGFSEAVQQSLATAQISAEILYLLGAAVGYGRSQERAMGEHPAGGKTDASKFQFLELYEEAKHEEAKHEN